MLLSESSKAGQVTYFTMAFDYGNQLSVSGERTCIAAVGSFVDSARKVPPVKTTYEVYRGRIIQPVRGDFDYRTQGFKVAHRNVFQGYEVEGHISGVLNTNYGQAEITASLNDVEACHLSYEAKLIF